MKNPQTKLILVAASALGLIQAAPAFAQSAPSASPPPENQLQDVVVTARRIDERLQDVPISITVLSQQSLANANIVNAEDLARITPSLSTNSNFGSDNSSFAIRGFIQENGTAPSVGVYFSDVVAPRGPSNGTPAGDGAGAGSYFDLQNVQVLKGPQGTLQGRNTTGGAVLLEPQKPTGRYEGYVEGSYGNYDMRRIQAVVNAPLGDTLRLRVGVDRQMRDGYLNNESGVGPAHLANVDYTALRASLVWDVTNNIENYTIFSYGTSNTYGDVQKMLVVPGGQLTSLAQAAAAKTPRYYDVLNTLPNPKSDVEQFQVINETTWQATDQFTLKNIVSYAELKDRSASSLFGVLLPVPGPGGTYQTQFAENTSIANGYSAHESTFTEELRGSGNAFDSRLSYQGGVYTEISLPIGTVGSQSGFLASCTNSAAFQCTDSLGGLFSSIYGLPPGFLHVGTVNLTEGRTSLYDLGLYGQATYKLNDQFKLTGGYRYTWDHESDASLQETFALDYPPSYGLYPSTTAAPNPSCTQPATAASGCVNHLYEDSSAPTWLLDLDYTPNRDLLVYVKYSRGYREGGIAPNVTAPFNTFRPEKVDAYEFGFKSTLHAPFPATFDAAVFYNDFSNQQIQVGFNAIPGSGVSSTASPINAGASTIYGLEIGATANPFHGLQVSVGYTYLHTRIDQVADLSSFHSSQFTLSAPFKVGDQIVLTPENKAVLDATYTLPFVPSNMGKMAFGATFTHTDKQLGNYADRTVTGFESYSWLPATDLLDLHANWNGIYGAPVDLSVFATNVTGEKYYVYAPGLATSGLGFDTIALGQPTMYGLRLKYHFGK